MKKKVTYFMQVIAVILLISFVCGCGAEVEEAPNRTSATLTRVSKDGEEASASNSSGTSGKPTRSTITPSDIMLGTATVTPEVTETASKNNYVITPVTEGLCEQLPVSELGELAAYNAFNRLEQNHKITVMLEHKVCIDDVTGVVYYVNVGRDYFLYRIKDGKSELAVELPANYLYTHGGVLYFLLDAQNILEGTWKDSVKGRYMYDKFTFEGMSEGDIYSYTPATGKVELVYPAQALRLKVTDEGIYYLKGQLDKNVRSKATGFEWYYLPFDGVEPKRIESGGMDDVWNGYRYELSEDMLRLKSESTGDVIEAVTEKGFGLSCIYKDMLFALDSSPVTILKCFDLCAKEELFSYKLAESVSATDWTSGLETSKRQGVARALKKIIEKGYVVSSEFALTEDYKLWFLVQQFIYCINLETGETQLFYFNDGGFASESLLYSDGKNLYAIYYVGGIVGEEPVFVRLVFGYEEETDIWYWDVTDKIGVND